MWLPILALIAGGALGGIAGGRLRSLAGHRIRGWGLALGGIGLELVAGNRMLGPAGEAVLLGGYVCLLGFAAANAHLAGVGVLAAGLVANLAVITADGAMPVLPTAVVRAGIATPATVAGVDYGPRHHPQRRGDHLTFLDDRIPLAPLHQVVSFGDLVLAGGVADVAAHLMQPAPRHRRRSRSHSVQRVPRWRRKETAMAGVAG
ncbi:MAG: DUF5317 family protein [Acidimicrobiales bacterium]